MDYSPPGSSVQDIFQARILEWVAISLLRGSSPHRDWTWVSWTPGEGTGYPLQYSWVSLVAQLVKNPPAVQETWVQSLGRSQGRSPGEGKGYPLQYSSLENSMDCRAHGVAKSRKRLSDFHFHSCTAGRFFTNWATRRVRGESRVLWCAAGHLSVSRILGLFLHPGVGERQK